MNSAQALFTVTTRPSPKPAGGRAHTLPPEHTSLAQAQRNFSRGLTRAAQLQLAHEVALTRGPELCLAYDNLVAVSSGFRTRRAQAGAAAEICREPCVGFIVQRKWPTPGRPGHPQALPKHLIAFGDVAGKRVLCAVPTDVRAKRDYGRPVPHDAAVEELPYGILVTRQDARKYSGGVATCAIRRPAAGDQVFLMSCRHVLSRTDLDLDTDETDLPVLQGTAALTPLGTTTGIRGSLDGGATSGFDAQLAAIDDDEALTLAMGGVAFDDAESYVRLTGDVPAAYWIATGRVGADGRRLLVGVEHLDTVVNFQMDYPQADGSKVRVTHDLVLHGRPSETLTFGDSGSPVILFKRGRTLIGMYIGGGPGNAYIIPAWQLMTPGNFGQAGESGWTLA